MLKDDTPKAKPKITYAGLASTTNFNHSVAHFLSPKANACDEDVYATGMIAYELLSGGKQPPIDLDNFELNSDDSDAKYEAQTIELSAHGLSWDSYSKHARDFVNKCLRQEPDDAFTVDKALQHPWIGVTTAKAISNPPLNKTRRMESTDEDMYIKDDDAISNERNCDSPVSLSHEEYIHDVVPSFDDDEKKEEEGLVEIIDTSCDETNAGSSRQSIPFVTPTKPCFPLSILLKASSTRVNSIRRRDAMAVARISR